MRYNPFWTGDKVITIVDYEGFPRGTVGRIHTKWAGTAYVVKLKDGSFRWLDSSELVSRDPNNPYQLKEGDVGVLISDKYSRNFAQVGDLFEVIKVANDVDYYEVAIGDVIKRFGGFQLAGYDRTTLPLA